MILSAPYLDEIMHSPVPFSRVLSPVIAGHVACSCVLAVSVNITNYLVLGKSGALTYQVSFEQLLVEVDTDGGFSSAFCLCCESC
jgi:hypothetical protein